MQDDPTAIAAQFSRREFLLRTGAAGLALGLGGAARLGWGQSFPRPPAEIVLSAEPGSAGILPGSPTAVKRFLGKYTGMGARALGKPQSYLGPAINVWQGQRLRVMFQNRVGEPSIVHWHGLDTPEAADGHPRFAVPDGDNYLYDFTILNRAGTYWYHPHPDGHTGPQVYAGLAGLGVVKDDAEAALPLPSGKCDIPCVIQDRLFDSENQLVYQVGGREGFLGDRVLVNGKPNPTYYVSKRCYRLRFLNGSNSRIYKLAWSDGLPMQVIATDGGLLAEPVAKPYVMLAPGQRVEVWVEFKKRQIGEELLLRSVSFEGAGLGGGSLPQGHPFDLMKFTVTQNDGDNLSLPKKLDPFERHDPRNAVNYKNPRTFEIVPSGQMWLFNGLPFEMENVSKNEIVQRGDLEIWHFKNDWPGLKIAHPIHLHGPQFQVVERTIDPAYKTAYDTVKDGYVDEGIVDTVLLMPGEALKIAIKFQHHAGLFLYHCHNLEHEDKMMMRNYRVLP